MNREQGTMSSEQVTVNNEQGVYTMYKQILTAFLIALCSFLICTCASSGSSGAAKDAHYPELVVDIISEISTATVHVQVVDAATEKIHDQFQLSPYQGREKSKTLKLPSGNYRIGYAHVFFSRHGTREWQEVSLLDDTRTTVSLTMPRLDEVSYAAKTESLELARAATAAAAAAAAEAARPLNAREQMQIARTAIQDLDRELSPKVRRQANVAMFPMLPKGGGDPSLLFDVMLIELVNTGNYTVIEKQMVDKLLTEYDFQMSGVVGVKTIGQLLGADVVVFGAVSPRAVELMAVDVDKFTTLAMVQPESSPGKVTLRPVNGARANEAATITNFLTISGYLTTRQSTNITEVEVNITPFGNKQMASILDSRGNGRGYLGKNYFNYADPLEFWVKLRGAKNTTSEYARGVWVVYRPGVNRAEAEQMVGLLKTELTSLGTLGLVAINDQTAAFESALSQVQGKVTTIAGESRPVARDMNWMALIDQYLREYKAQKVVSVAGFGSWPRIEPDLSDNIISLPRRLSQLNTGISESPSLWIDVSRQGNRTRIEIIRGEGFGSYAFDYASPAEFRRNVRSNAYRAMSYLYMQPFEKLTAVSSKWQDSIDLLKDSVPPPSNFLKMDSLYVAKMPTTQREYEAIMGSNPSTTKGANLPVTNVSLIEAMEYCNRLSLRDGLLPAYQYFYNFGTPRSDEYLFENYTPYTDENGKLRVRTTQERRTIISYTNRQIRIKRDPDASGYRLPTAAEWRSASSDKGLSDMMGTVGELVFGETEFTEQTVTYLGAASTGAGGTNALVLPHPIPREAQIHNEIIKRGDDEVLVKTPYGGFRVVRPIFNYWSY